MVYNDCVQFQMEGKLAVVVHAPQTTQNLFTVHVLVLQRTAKK